MKRFFSIIFATFFLVGVLFAQEDRGRISGLVIDPTGAVIPNAEVSLLNEATGVQQKTISNEGGAYIFDLLIPGLYQVRVDMPGFKQFSMKHIRIEVAGRVGVQAKLEVGQTNDSVTVTATNVAQLKTEDAIIGYTVETRSAEELPFINPLDLQWLSPGVLSTTLTNGTGPENTTVNGSQSGRTEFTLDGAPDTRNGGAVTSAYVPVREMIGELRVITSPYDASLAHTSGGSIDTSLKSGTKDYHGSVNGYYQDPNVDAPQFSQGKAVPPASKSHNEDFTLGGPIFPRKLFFFQGYEHSFSASAASTSTQTIPTPAEIGGDFSSLLSAGKPVTTKYTCPSTNQQLVTDAFNSYQIFNPYSTRPDPLCPGMFVRDAVPNNVLTGVMPIDPVAKAILSHYPAPNGSATQTADGHNNFISTAANTNTEWSEVTRIDYTINDSQKLFGHYILSTQTQPGKNLYFPGASGRTNLMKNKGAVVDYINTINANTLLNVRYSLTRYNILTTIDAKTTATDLGVNPNATAGIPEKFLGFPYVATDYAELGNADPSMEADTTHDAQVNVNRSLGRHQFKIGAEYRLYQANIGDYTNSKLYIGASNNYSKGPSSASAASAIGQSLAELELGISENTKETLPAATANNTSYWAGYIQDDWKATPQLTFNFGLRYEYFGALSERHGKSLTYFDPSVASPIASAVIANYAAGATAAELSMLPVSNLQLNGGLHFATPGAALWNPQKNNFSPRIGFSYSPLTKLVVRGGFGIFYQHIGEYAQYGVPDGFTQTTPTTSSLDNGQTYIATLSNPFPNGLQQPTGSSLGYYQDIGTTISKWFVHNPKSPMSLHYSLGFEYALPSDLIFEANYVGSLTRHARITRDWDAFPDKYLSTDKTRTPAMTALNNALSTQYANPFNNVSVPVSYSMLTQKTITLNQLMKPYPQFSDVSSADYSGISSYNALQMTLQKRFSHGYNMSAVYTWSRTLDALTFLNAGDAKPWYGTSNSDYPQMLSLAAIYELPFGKGKTFLNHLPKWANQFLGFQVDGTYRIQSGQPLTFSDNATVLKTGMTTKNINGPSKHNTQQWFNTDAFDSILEDANYSNDEALVANLRTFPLRFNNVRQDFQNMMDLGAMKKFTIMNFIDAKFRADAFNAMNHQVFTNPNVSPASTSFGKISGPGNSSRYLQFGLQMNF
jgi:hypothetical protein